MTYPSGYSWLSDNWQSLLAAGIGITVSIITAGTGTGLGVSIWAGACGGFAGALLSGADIGQAFKAGVIGGLVGAASGFLNFGSGDGRLLEHLFKHAFSDVWMAGIQGGDMTDMKAAFMCSVASCLGGDKIKDLKGGTAVFANAILGGTVSAIGGGKFANGAITAAYQMRFNDLMHSRKQLFPNLTDAEKKLAAKYPCQALSIAINKDEALEVTRQMFPDIEDAHNNTADAFRHAYFNALNTRSIGAELANQFGSAHEARGNNPIHEKAMDLNNNSFGINTALRHPCWSNKQIATYIYNSVNSGKLLMIENNRLVPTHKEN